MEAAIHSKTDTLHETGHSFVRVDEHNSNNVH
jgi:hypothetical protein